MIITLRKTLSFHSSPICHCISSDKALGAGFAAQVPQPHLDQLRFDFPKNPSIGSVLVTTLETEGGMKYQIAHMVTKKLARDKPTMEDFERTFNELVLACRANSWRRIHCPRIGAGLDGLSWTEIEPMLRNTYDIEFVVYIPTPEQIVKMQRGRFLL